jgi:hypothetical protein
MLKRSSRQHSTHYNYNVVVMDTDVKTLLGSIPAPVAGCPTISLVFREMWDTTGLPLKPAAGFTAPYGCPMSATAYVGRQRWAKPNQSL